jgi:hypothetical protein
MAWIKGFAAFGLLFGFIGLAFWKSRGVQPSGDRTSADDAPIDPS